MKSGRHIDNFALEPHILECCVIPLFVGTNVRIIHLCCYFFRINDKIEVKCEILIDNQ